MVLLCFYSLFTKHLHSNANLHALQKYKYLPKINLSNVTNKPQMNFIITKKYLVKIRFCCFSIN